jgi:hypothetical protein
MRITQILESVSIGGMGTNSVATAPSKSGKMIRRQKPSDNALNSGKLFQETNAAEGKDDKIAQLKKDHDTAVHWSKNEKSPQKREAARQKAEKIKRHLDTQYKQGVAEGLSKRDQQDVAAIRAAIARLEAQLKQPNADRDAIQQSIAHEKKRLALYGQGVAEGGASMPGDQYLSIPADQTKLSIGQQMAQDGITYSPDKEDELIGLMAQYMKKAGMSSKQIRYYLSYDEDFIPDQLSDLPKQGAAEGFPKDPNAPKLVRDRKTGKQYDPNKEFEKKMNSPEVMAQMKRMAQKEGAAEDSVKENKKGVRAVKHTVKPRNFVAKNAAATTSGAGAHKDKKKAMKQGETKHKGKEPAYESKLWAALDRRIIK